MDDNNVDLKYDESTGLSQNKHVFYAQALKDSTKTVIKNLLSGARAKETII